MWAWWHPGAGRWEIDFERAGNLRVADLEAAIARWVHGITDERVADAPPWADVLPKLLDVTAGRTVLAYNASFDQGVVVQHSHRDGLDPAHLADHRTWSCLMNRRTDWELCRRRLPLNGNHSPLGDCHTAYDLLQSMTSPSR